MKKHTTLLLIFVCGAVLLTACGTKEAPKDTVPAVTAHTDAPDKSSDSAPQAEERVDAPGEAAPDIQDRDDPAVQRDEIAKMIYDANELIEEGLFDDAKMAIRDLKSRDLTDEEKEQVNALQAKMLTIQD